MYIPCNLQIRQSNQVPTAATVYPPPEVSSFTLQVDIDPNKIIARFKQFKFNSYMNEFGFCDEYGAEYFVHCFKRDFEKEIKAPLSLAKQVRWSTVVTISDSLDPIRDVNNFLSWVSDNFT